jgi:hypothetical protein
MARTQMQVPTRSARHVTPGPTHRFVVATQQLDGGIPLVSVSGEVDLATAPALELSNPNVLRIFEITGFDQIFEINPSLGAAIDHNGHGHG